MLKMLYCYFGVGILVTIFRVSALTNIGDRLRAEEEALKIVEILNRVDLLLYQRYNLIKRPDIFPVLDTGIPMAVYDDIRFTLPQAERILEALSSDDNDETSRRSKNERRVFPDEWAKWQFPIRYAFDGTHSDEQKDIIREGISWWNLVTCVEFQELPSPDVALRQNLTRLLITKGEKCQSNVGNTGNFVQEMSLGEGCLSPGIVAHEFGHILGMFHEHMRPDRDDYVKVLLANIVGSVGSFSTIPADYDIDYGTGYDLASIMHYDSLGFSSNYWGKLRTIETLDPFKMTTLGDRTRLSFYDAKRVNFHYNCTAKMCSDVALAQSCQNGGYQDPKNCARCRCPFGIFGDFCEQLVGSSSNDQENCGGIVDIEPCSTAIITLPTFPEPYSPDMDCSWLVRTTAGGIIFGQRGPPDMQCTSGDTCIDYFEIRDDLNKLDKPGDRFCMCGKSAGRIGVIDGHEAQVYFHSAPNKFKRYNGRFFELHAFATCGEMPASQVTTECIITESGYDYEGSTFTKTESGQSCMPWAGQTKHWVSSFPDNSLLEAGNACRNPTSDPYGPWCYVDSDYSKPETCVKMPHCAEIADRQKPDAPTRPFTRFMRPTSTPATTTTAVPTKKRYRHLANIAKNSGKKPVGHDGAVIGP